MNQSIEIAEGLKPALVNMIGRQVSLELGSSESSLKKLRLFLSPTESTESAFVSLSGESYVCEVEGQTIRGQVFNYTTRSSDIQVAVSDAVARLRRDLVRLRMASLASSLEG